MAGLGAVLIAMIAVACAVAAEGTAMGAPVPTDVPRGAARLEFTDVDLDCAGALEQFDYEVDTGDQEAFDANNEGGGNPTVPSLEKKPRLAHKFSGHQEYPLLCLTYTYEKANHKAAVLHNAWGPYCTRHIIITNVGPIAGVDDKDVVVLLPDGGESNDNLWEKTRAFIKRLALDDDSVKPDVRFADYDYIFVGGDDVQLIPPNLQAIFNEPATRSIHDAGGPMFIGTRFVSPPGGSVTLNDHSDIDNAVGYERHGEFLSGSGYILNKQAVQLLNANIRNGKCWPGLRTHAEDVYIAKCLEEQSAVLPRDTKDAQGEDRVIVMTAGHMSPQAHDPDYTWWFRDFKPFNHPRGRDIVSRHLITFHYVSPDDVKRLTKQYLGGVPVPTPKPAVVADAAVAPPPPSTAEG